MLSFVCYIKGVTLQSIKECFMETKYIFVTGGVVSSLGKGIISASIGKLLQARGYKVTIQKFDPYINIDPGTLNPYEHGECYVTEDGFETDLDLGHYERFTGIHTTRNNSITTGRIYKTVIDRERHGDYLGKTIQVVPHITDEIKRRMLRSLPLSPSDWRGNPMAQLAPPPVGGGREGAEGSNHVRALYEPFTVEEINNKIVEMLRPKGMQAPVELVFQSIEGLHKACPNHPGDWYFTGRYPTPGGTRLCNQAFVNYIEKVLRQR